MRQICKQTSEDESVWTTRIQEWQTSGKSISRWCHEKGIPYHHFLKWRYRLSNKMEQGSLNFVELVEERSCKVGVELTLAGIKVSLDKDFDEHTLLRCLQVLRKL